MTLEHYILEGKQIKIVDLSTWTKWFETADRHIAKDYVKDSYISTEFLGVDHQSISGGPPLLFKTMVYGGPMDGKMNRYTTYDEAKDGHQLMIWQVKKSYLKVINK